MKEKDYINVAHLAYLRAASKSLMQVTGSLLKDEEEAKLLAEVHNLLELLIERIRARIKIT